MNLIEKHNEMSTDADGNEKQAQIMEDEYVEGCNSHIDDRRVIYVGLKQ